MAAVRFFSSEQPQNMNEQVHFPLTVLQQSHLFHLTSVGVLPLQLKFSISLGVLDMENPNPQSCHPVKSCSCFPGIKDLLKSFVTSEQPKHQALSDDQRQWLCSHSLLELEPGKREHRDDSSTNTSHQILLSTQRGCVCFTADQVRPRSLELLSVSVWKLH